MATINLNSNADSIVQNLSKLPNSSDFATDNLGGKAPTIYTNWTPECENDIPMCYLSWNGIVSSINPSNNFKEFKFKGEIDSKTNKFTLWSVIFTFHEKITERNNGLPCYKYYKSGNNVYLYTVFTDDDDSERKRRIWFQIAGNDKEHYKYSLVYNNTTQVITNEDKEETNEDKEKTKIDTSTLPSTSIEGTNDYEDTQGDYESYLTSSSTQELIDFWSELYGADNGFYSLQSHQSIIGLPLQFMSNVDMRVGASTYGKQYMEDILYDMNIAIIKPGGPVMTPSFNGSEEYSNPYSGLDSAIRTYGKLKAYYDSIKNDGAMGFMKQFIFMMMKGNSARFYSFMSDYTHYTHYVNTLCHMFVTFLGIDNKEYTTSTGVRKKYANYVDDISEIESDQGKGLMKQFGTNNAVYIYYSDNGSALNQSFHNETMQSSLQSTISDVSNKVKEYGFFMNAAGIENGKQILNDFGAGITNALATAPSSLLSRLFANVAEGATTILAGNNISLPEIYADSDTDMTHTFKIRLVSPYGDPESVFLYVLRPLARLLAFSLPLQYGPNSYRSPFIVQAFSKGQFNCQLGIVKELSIERCGSNGESHTINHIPTELEVNLTIADMYDKVFLSNEYFGNSKGKAFIGGLIDHWTGSNAGEGLASAILGMGSGATAMKLLFNNVGLIDFLASFCGFNLNMPSGIDGWTLLSHMIQNRTQEIIKWRQNDDWMFPQWEKSLNDAYNDAVTNLKTGIVLTN